jgi:hypothetical protein
LQSRFQEAIKVILDLGRDGRGSRKAVVFTESITTQEYLRRLLLAISLGDEDITLFRGVWERRRPWRWVIAESVLKRTLSGIEECRARISALR